MSGSDNTKPAENEELLEDLESEEHPLEGDPSDALAAALDWDRDRVQRVQDSNNQGSELFLAFADGDEHRNPSPFKPQDNPPQKGGEANENAMPAFFKDLPQGAADATQRAYEALKTVKAGEPLAPEQRSAFDQALKDAGKLDPAFVSAEEAILVEALQTKERRLPDGTLLPTWTQEKEKQFVEKLISANKAMNELGADSRQKLADYEDRVRLLDPQDSIRRGVFRKMLDQQASGDPALKDYLDKKDSLDKFTSENAAGLVRRGMHQQEMSVLHARSVVSGIYAIALDKSGQAADRPQLETLLKDSIADRFAPANIPELIELVDKYKLEEKESKELDDKVPGRKDLNEALAIMNDEKQGSLTERLAKARPLFEKAIGQGELVDQQKTLAEIEKVSRERNELGENISAEKLNELDAKAVELVEKARLPFEARIKFAMALQAASAESQNLKLNEEAVSMLKAAENLDQAYKLNPLVQGALLLAQKQPPQNFSLEEAEEAGKPEVEKRKAELVKEGKLPDDRPAWLKALYFGGEMLLGAAAFHLIGKYVFGPIGRGKNYLSRSWEMSSRMKNLTTESVPSLIPGDEPRLYLKTKDGKELPVDGVKKEDGRLRVFDGEKTELVKPGKGDSLFMKVAPDTSPEQVKEAARKKLTPAGDEKIIDENRERFKEQIQLRDQEIAELKRANEILQAKMQAEAKVEAPAPEQGRTEQSRTEQSRTEQSRTEQSRTEQPRPQEARPERVVPTADKLQGTNTTVAQDGSLEKKDARPGEVFAREQLERRDKVDPKEIDAMKRGAEELAKSDKETDRQKAEAMKRTVEALEGRLGAEAQAEAHKTVLAESKKALERGEGGGYGRAITGGLIGVGILATAALAYYRYSMKEQEQKALERARVK